MQGEMLTLLEMNRKHRLSAHILHAPNHPKGLSVTAPLRIRHFQIAYRVKHKKE